jgi:hypothetical protein
MNGNSPIVLSDIEEKKKQQAMMAMTIQGAAKVAHGIMRAYRKFHGDDSQKLWHEAEQSQRESIVQAVMAIMHNPTITEEQLHSVWLAGMKSDGWTQGEEEDAEKKTHPSMVPYNDLPAERRLQDVLFSASVRTVLGLER